MPTTPSREAARAAFDQLDTQEKSAFIFEATFTTIGQALEETGRRVSDIFESINLDDMFTADPADAPPAKPKKSASRKKSAPRKKTTPRAKTTPPPSKTAGKTKPSDDEA